MRGIECATRPGIIGGPKGSFVEPPITGKVREALDAVAGRRIDDPEATCALWRQRRWRVVDRLGKQIVDDLLAGRRRGVTFNALAKHYGISLSNVKRLLKTVARGGEAR